MRYEFADCTLDAQRHELARGNELVAVEPQVFDLLCLLVRNAGDLITHEQVLEEVWNGRIVSESAISSRINAARKAVGDNGKDQHIIKTVARRGFRLNVPVSAVASAMPEPSSNEEFQQTVKYTSSSDGTSIAYAVSGQGPSVMRAGHFLTHLEKDWQSPIWRPYLDALGASHTLVRYDQRGTGLSERELRDPTVETYSADLNAVADAAGLSAFPLIASSQGVPVAIHFAANHPDRVSRLVLYGGFALGRMLRDPDHGEDEANALLAMIRAGWGKPQSGFMVAFTALFCPDASHKELENLVDIQLASASPDNAAIIRREIDRFDVRDLLEKVQAPTLVIHARNDSVHPVSQGQLIASRIPNAEFLQIESNNHILLPSHPTFDKVMAAKLAFLDRPT